MAVRDLAIPAASLSRLELSLLGTYPRLRVLAWDSDVLYASRGYTLLRARVSAQDIEWQHVAEYQAPWWRGASSQSRLAARLFRDGFHALAVMPSGHIVGAVPGAIVALAPGKQKFAVTHKILRGTRPLHLCATPDGRVFWGEYFDNPRREEVHIYSSADNGATWQVTYTFPPGAVRHVHNIVYDKWADCLWVLTGDNGAECRILRASCDFRRVETVLSGNQQARAVAALPREAGLYFSSDTPSEGNHIYCLDRRANLTPAAELGGSSIYGCMVGDTAFFSTMVEPSEVNRDRHVRLVGSLDGVHWLEMLKWRKDAWPMKLFQYGNAFLPDGRNTSGILAVTTVAVTTGDLESSLWRVAGARAGANRGGLQ